MKHLNDFLLLESINLSVKAKEGNTALKEVMKLLQYDPRVSHWENFCQSILERPLFSLRANDQAAIMIAHGRTSSVRDLVMAAGRNTQGITFHDSEQPVLLLFIVGIPHELSTEYLRIMGSIARACGNPETLEKLLSTENSHDFMTTLSSECEG